MPHKINEGKEIAIQLEGVRLTHLIGSGELEIEMGGDIVVFPIATILRALKVIEVLA